MPDKSTVVHSALIPNCKKSEAFLGLPALSARQFALREVVDFLECRQLTAGDMSSGGVHLELRIEGSK